MELRDSESGEVLARVADRRAAESPFAFEVNNVTAWSEVRRLGQAGRRCCASVSKRSSKI